MPFPTYDFGAALDGGHHERREVGVVGEVHLGPARHEGLDALDAPVKRRHVQGSPPQSVPSKAKVEGCVITRVILSNSACSSLLPAVDVLGGAEFAQN